MNFSPQVKSWIILASLVIGTGSAAAFAAAASGANKYASIGIGIGVAATNVYHALQSSPNEQPTTKETK
jgi:hypothetical protein